MLSHRKIDKTWWRPPTHEDIGLRWPASTAYATSYPVRRPSADLEPSRPPVQPARTAFPHHGHTLAIGTTSALASTSGATHTGAAPQRHPNYPALEDTNSARFGHVDYCTYCGESNHRSHNCHYGMHVRYFQCHRDGRKQKFCDYYCWRYGKEGDHTIKLNSWNDDAAKKCTNVYTTDDFISDHFINVSHVVICIGADFSAHVFQTDIV